MHNPCPWLTSQKIHSLTEPAYLHLCSFLCLENLQFLLAVIFPLSNSIILSLSARSPMFAHLSATLDGLPTIRASNKVDKIVEEFSECQDHQSGGWFLFISTARWFSMRLEVILIIFVAAAVFAPLILIQYISKYHYFYIYCCIH